MYFSTFEPMAKRFKLKFPNVIHSLQICRQTDPSSLPENPIPAIRRLSPTKPKTWDISFPSLRGPPPTPERLPSTKCHGSSKNMKPKSCSRCRISTQFLFSDCSSEFPDYSCKASSVAITEKYYFKQKENKKKKKKKNKGKPSSAVRTSVSSAGMDDYEGFSGSEGEEDYDESRTLVDYSRTFSDDDSSSSSLDTSYENDKPNAKAAAVRLRKTGTKVRRRLKRHPSIDWRGSCSSSVGAVAKAVSTRQWMGRSTVEGKARESFAVVKKSEDPYEDFKRSMLEMIMEKQMFDARDLEELLQCFLTLNSRQYHEVIVDAFSEIWEALFYNSSVKHHVRYYSDI